MAIIKSAIVGKAFDMTGAMAPKGTWLATCVDTKDQLGVVRPKYGVEGETETLDLTTFLFEFADQTGKRYKIATKGMRISGSEKSGLFTFLRSWLGQPPKVGLNTVSLKGQRAFVTVDHVPGLKNPSLMFANILAISPVPQGYGLVEGDGAVTHPASTAPVEQQPTSPSQADTEEAIPA